MDKPISQHPYEQDDINLLDLWLVVWNYKKLIAILCFGSVAAAMIFGLSSPKIYISTTSILIPKENEGSGFLSVLGASGIAQRISGVSIPSLTPNRDIFISILKSNSLAQKLVENHSLKDHYKTLHNMDAIDALKRATKISVSEEGVIQIEVQDVDPKMASSIANSYPEYLDRFMARNGTGAAGRQRDFIESRLIRTKTDLEKAEETLRRFREVNRAISIKDQAKGAIDVAARLKGEIIASEVQLEVMRNSATDSNPDVVRLKQKLVGLKHQLAQAQYGAGIELPVMRDNSSPSRREIYIAASKMPKVGLELGRLLRDVKVQETVYLLLTQQVEQAKIAEAKDTPVVQVLDRAVPALRKSKPKIKRNMALAGVTSLVLGIFFAFLFEYIERLRIRERRSTQLAT